MKGALFVDCVPETACVTFIFFHERRALRLHFYQASDLFVQHDTEPESGCLVPKIARAENHAITNIMIVEEKVRMVQTSSVNPLGNTRLYENASSGRLTSWQTNKGGSD